VSLFTSLVPRESFTRRFPSLVGAVAMAVAGVGMVVAPPPVGASNGNVLVRNMNVNAAIGGTGGVTFGPDSCRTNTVVTGIQTSYWNGYLANLSFVCSSISVSGSTVTISGRNPTTARGTTAGTYPTPANMNCQAGQVVTGLQLWKGTSGLGGIGPLCDDIRVTNAKITVGSNHSLGGSFQASSLTTSAGSPACPNGSVVMGFEGRAGDYIDNFTAFCGSFSNSFVTPTVAFADNTWSNSYTWGVTAKDSASNDTTFPNATKTSVGADSYSAWTAVPGGPHPTAAFTSSTADCPTTVKVGDDVACTVTVNGKPDARITATGPATMTAGDSGNIQVTIDNYGPGGAATSFSLSSTGGFTWSPTKGCLVTTNVITCNGPDLAGSPKPGSGLTTPATATIGFTVNKTVKGLYVLGASVTATNDFDTTNDRATVSMTIASYVPPATTPTPTVTPSSVAPSTIVAASPVPAFAMPPVNPCSPGNATIQGDIVIDLNNNGIVDPDETSVSGVQVELHSGTVTCQSTQTRSPYVFNNVGPGDYEIVIVGKPGLAGSSGTYRTTITGAGITNVPTKLIAPVTPTSAPPTTNPTPQPAAAAPATVTPPPTIDAEVIAKAPVNPAHVAARTSDLALTGNTTLPLITMSIGLIGIGLALTRKTRKN
jgi:SdrD B-like domain